MVLNLKQSSSDFAVVRCQQRIVDEVTLKELSINEGNTTEDGGLSLFDNCLFFQNGFYIQPVSYMVKTSALKETTHFDIYTNRHAGQNWQLLLPVFYSYRCIMIKEVLTNILNRATSHSRGQYKKYEDLILKSECFENVAVETVKRIEAMPSEIKKQYIDKLKYNGLRERMAIAYKNRKRKDYANFFHKWAENSNDARCLGNRLTYLAVKLHIEKVWDFCHRYVDK